MSWTHHMHCYVINAFCNSHKQKNLLSWSSISVSISAMAPGNIKKPLNQLSEKCRPESPPHYSGVSPMEPTECRQSKTDVVQKNQAWAWIIASVRFFEHKAKFILGASLWAEAKKKTYLILVSKENSASISTWTSVRLGTGQAVSCINSKWKLHMLISIHKNENNCFATCSNNRTRLFWSRGHYINLIQHIYNFLLAFMDQHPQTNFILLGFH